MLSIFCQRGVAICTHKKSLAIVALISSIECMVRADELKREGKVGGTFKCKKRFVEYLTNNVSHTPNSIKKYEELYSIRCDISHAGNMFLADKKLTFDNQDQQNQDYISLLEAMQLARLSLFNWLLS